MLRIERRGTYSDDVDEAENEDHDAGCQHEAPERQTQRFLARGLFVHVAEDVVPKHQHGAAEKGEAMGGAEDWPHPRVVLLEDGALRDQEEHCEALAQTRNQKGGLTARESGDYVRGSIEEEELGDCKGLDDHDDGGNYHGDEARDVHCADGVEDDEAWASQAFARERHFGRSFEIQEVDCKELESWMAEAEESVRIYILDVDPRTKGIGY